MANPAKVIMIQGTASGVGKSILSTALCRIFTQDGYRVAPFKSQNMSANAHTLENGDKIARSQALAAFACNITPSPLMNPILLMPTSKSDTEVILKGKSAGFMSQLQYGNFKQHAFETAIEAYYEMANDYDIIVIEGAGSPVEMNLIKNGDTANMGIAERIGAPTLLVSDIQRGGVFAALYGTMMLFTEGQRALVRGMVINKFIGELAYFSDGKDILEELCKVPCAGIIPYCDIKLEDEDCLTDGAPIKTSDGLFSGSEHGYAQFLDVQFDAIANHFRAHLDMKKIYEILGEVRS